jgi:hypothetical protein
MYGRGTPLRAAIYVVCLSAFLFFGYGTAHHISLRQVHRTKMFAPTYRSRSLQRHSPKRELAPTIWAPKRGHHRHHSLQLLPRGLDWLYHELLHRRHPWPTQDDLAFYGVCLFRRLAADFCLQPWASYRWALHNWGRYWPG